MDDKMVEVSEGKLNELLERLQRLEKGAVLTRPKRVTNHTAYIRTLNGRPIVGVGQAVAEIDPITRRENLTLELTVLEEEGEKEVTVPYLAFLNEPNQVKVLIKEQKAHEKVTVTGYVNTSPTDPVNTKHFSSEEVPMEVKTITYDVTIEVLEGELKGLELTVPNDALNI
jgi:hypothetical protein